MLFGQLGRRVERLPQATGGKHILEIDSRVFARRRGMAMFVRCDNVVCGAFCLHSAIDPNMTASKSILAGVDVNPQNRDFILADMTIIIDLMSRDNWGGGRLADQYLAAKRSVFAASSSAQRRHQRPTPPPKIIAI
jgi:hypothetical protein